MDEVSIFEDSVLPSMPELSVYEAAEEYSVHTTELSYSCSSPHWRSGRIEKQDALSLFLV